MGKYFMIFDTNKLSDRYKANPPNLQNKRDGFMQKFLARHTLSYRNGVLIIARHNEIPADIIHLDRQAFYPKRVYGEPLIHLGRSIYEEEVRHGGNISEKRGEVSIRGLWEIHTEAIIDAIFGDADA